MNAAFDPRRLWLLIRSDVVADYRTLGITCAALAALLLISSATTVVQAGETAVHYLPWYYGMLFIWGPLLASYSFRELHDKTRNEAYLLLPASAFEKTLARVLRGTIGFFVFSLIFLTATSAVVEGINWLVFGRRNGLFNPFDAVVWAPVGHFLASVSLYLLGAAWFRKLHFIKTALTLMAIPIALACVAALVGRLLFDESAAFVFAGGDVHDYYLANRGFFDALLGVLKFLYFVVLPVFCWWVAWLRVQETQVSHGV